LLNSGSVFHINSDQVLFELTDSKLLKPSNSELTESN